MPAPVNIAIANSGKRNKGIKEDNKGVPYGKTTASSKKASITSLTSNIAQFFVSVETQSDSHTHNGSNDGNSLFPFIVDSDPYPAKNEMGSELTVGINDKKVESMARFNVLHSSVD